LKGSWIWDLGGYMHRKKNFVMCQTKNAWQTHLFSVRQSKMHGKGTSLPCAKQKCTTKTFLIKSKFYIENIKIVKWLQKTPKFYIKQLMLSIAYRKKI
jgi:hypothetical protein